MSRSRIQRLPNPTWSSIERIYPTWRSRRYPEAGAISDAEWKYLYEALNRTYFIDGDDWLVMHQIADEVIDEWVGAENDLVKQRELSKADFRIL